MLLFVDTIFQTVKNKKGVFSYRKKKKEGERIKGVEFYVDWNFLVRIFWIYEYSCIFLMM